MTLVTLIRQWARAVDQGNWDQAQALLEEGLSLTWESPAETNLWEALSQYTTTRRKSEAKAGGGESEGKGPACTFCGARKSAVASLVAGPGVYICDRCVDRCAKVVQARKDPELPLGKR